MITRVLLQGTLIVFVSATISDCSGRSFGVLYEFVWRRSVLASSRQLQASALYVS